MSVLIKGMEMPERCEKCFMCQSDCMGCKGTQNFIILKKGQNKPTWCPLIEVPPHGRLIDGDAFLKLMEDLKDPEKPADDWVFRICRGAIARMPVIIEAEGEENG